MRVVTDKTGPRGGDETCRDLCHFEDPQTPTIREVIDFVLSRGNWGKLNVFETYDSDKDELGARIASYEYKYGVLIKSTSYGKFLHGHYVEGENVEVLKEKRVKLVSIVGGWSCYDYNLCLVK